MNFKLKLSVLILLVSLLLGVSSCKEKEKTMQDKKAELEKLEKQLHSLKSKIYDLKQEIKAETKDESNDGAVLVDAMVIKRDTFRRFINVQGSVESDRVAVLSSRMGGNVLDILVNEGDIVKKGQLLIKIDDATMQSQLSELNTRLTFVKDVYEKQKRLWEQKAGSEMQYLQAKNNYEAMLKNKETMEEQIKNTRIYAPFTGYVDYIFPKIGEMLMPGMPAIKLTDMANVKVVADISESYLNSIKRGVPVVVTFEDIGDTVEGKIMNVSKSIDVKNRTFHTEIKLKRLPKGLRPYQICKVSVNDVTKNNVIVLPLPYIQRSEGSYFVFVIDEKTMTARKRVVKTGLANDTEMEILNGLKAGEKIITKGVQSVVDGQKVKIISNKLIF